MKSKIFFLSLCCSTFLFSSSFEIKGDGNSHNTIIQDSYNTSKYDKYDIRIQELKQVYSSKYYNDNKGMATAFTLLDNISTINQSNLSLKDKINKCNNIKLNFSMGLFKVGMERQVCKDVYGG